MKSFGDYWRERGVDFYETPEQLEKHVQQYVAYRTAKLIKAYRNYIEKVKSSDSKTSQEAEK